jgi:4-hydroxybenzoate polyprenyltransferase
VLDGLVSGSVAVLAGGSIDLAIRIGLSMTLLQLGIGTVNDLVDAPRDAGRKAGKPIPAGLVPARGALVLAGGCFAVGAVIAAAVSLATGLLAVLVIGIGLAYDLMFKGTAWSWLPFAIGIPILPVYGWIAATGTLDPVFAILLPAAVAAGAALAIGNALVDLERDQAAGISSIAVALGGRTAARLGVALIGTIWVLAWSSALRDGASLGLVAVVAAVGLIPLAVAAWATTALGPGNAVVARRERLWQAEAVGLALLAATWLAVVVGSGGRAA